MYILCWYFHIVYLWRQRGGLKMGIKKAHSVICLADNKSIHFIKNNWKAFIIISCCCCFPSISHFYYCSILHYKDAVYIGKVLSINYNSCQFINLIVALKQTSGFILCHNMSCHHIPCIDNRKGILRFIKNVYIRARFTE